jgi:hypothetical protein
MFRKPTYWRLIPLLVAFGVLAGGNICPSDCTGDDLACSHEHLCCAKAEESCCHRAHREHLNQPRTLLGTISQIGLKLSETFPVGPCGCCRSHQTSSPADPKDQATGPRITAPAVAPYAFRRWQFPEFCSDDLIVSRPISDDRPIFLRTLHFLF